MKQVEKQKENVGANYKQNACLFHLIFFYQSLNLTP